MPHAARVGDPTQHGNVLSTGPGSTNVLIGYMPAWRAVPTSVASAIDGLSNAVKSFMDKAPLTPPSAASDLVQIGQKMVEAAAKAAAAGAPGAVGAAAGGMSALISTNVALTATWTAASAAPGGQPAANEAYTQGIKTAAGAAASGVMSAMAGLSDMHICPVPAPPPPHGPGMVTKGSGSVLINDLPAARKDDKVMEACGGADGIASGCTSVEIGD
jgi:uncharacterized Zn-binding protein involved in type VI secretion